MNRFVAIVPLALALVLPCGQSRVVPRRCRFAGKVDSRIRTAAYDADEVYRLHGFVGYVIELIFEEGETFAGKGGGDLEGVTIDAHANSVLLEAASRDRRDQSRHLHGPPRLSLRLLGGGAPRRIVSRTK